MWPRDESWLRKPKLLIRDLAPRTAFALDQSGAIFLVGGTAIVPEQAELLLPLLAYINSSVIDALLRRSMPQFRGDFQKFEPRHLQGVPVLERVIDDENFSGELAALAMKVIDARTQGGEGASLRFESEIDNLIQRAAADSGIELDT